MNAALLRIVQGLMFAALLWMPETGLAQKEAREKGEDLCGFELGELLELLDSRSLKVIDAQNLLQGIYGASESFKKIPAGKLSDNRFGPLTRRWIEQFCRDFLSDVEKRRPRDLIDAFEHYERLDKQRFEWLNVLQVFDSSITSDIQKKILERVERNWPGAALILSDHRFLSWLKEPWSDRDAVSQTLRTAGPANPDSEEELASPFRDLLRQLRHIGSPAVVETLLDDFSEAQPELVQEILTEDSQPSSSAEGSDQDGRSYYMASKEAVEKVTQLKLIQDVAYPSHRLLMDAAVAAMNGFERPSSDDKQTIDPVIRLPFLSEGETRKSIDPPSSLYPAMAIDDKDCSCAPAFNSVTYGILTPWLANKFSKDQKEKAEDDEPPSYPVNFGILNRIGFQDLVLDEEGRRDQNERWDRSFDVGGFIAKAHRYNTEVDMIVRVRGLSAWDLDDKKTIDDAVDAVVDRLQAERPHRRKAGIGWLEWLGDLFDADRLYGTELDGVTVFFDDHETLVRKSDVAETFLVELLSALEGEYNVNIALNARPDEAEPALASIKEIIDIPDPEEGDDFWRPILKLLPWYEKRVDPEIDLVLLFLPEPTTVTKKQLRTELDASKTLRGGERMEVFRRIVAVIPPNGHERPDPVRERYAQFEDDLVYFRDNYKGIGFWPLPRQAESQPDPFADLIRQQFTEDVTHGWLTQLLIATGQLKVCDVICPNRVQVRGLLGLLVLGLVSLYAATLISCSFRERTAPYRGVLLMTPLAIALLILCALLACDPGWRGMGGWVAAVLAAVVAVIFIGRFLTARRGEVP